jgi:hypothetical protein
MNTDREELQQERSRDTWLAVSAVTELLNSSMTIEKALAEVPTELLESLAAFISAELQDRAYRSGKAEIPENPF